MDYDYDNYDNLPPVESDFIYPDGEAMDGIVVTRFSIDELIYHCIFPTFFQSIHTLSHVLLWIILFRFSTQVIPLTDTLRHILSAISGFLCIYSIFPTSYFLLLILPVVSYFVLFLPGRRGLCVLIASTIFLVICELIWLETRIWHQIRGPQMIVIMKAVSLGFDLDIGIVKDVPNIVRYLGYMLCPGNCLFGPWTSYNDYIGIYKQLRWRMAWVRSVIYSANLSLVFLAISTCGVHYLMPNAKWKWVIAYRDALSFRCSHYFVSYLSQFTLLMAGFTKTALEDNVIVSRPSHVELPRSLMQVVVSWNIPMHSWLKLYVFNTTRMLGNFAAVISTYAVSALLHGLNFQLAAVLLSLGLYSYVEFMLRKKLSNIFSACIQARACKEGCGHKNQWYQPAVLAVNIIFSLLTVLHLTYLGVMFDQSEQAEIGYTASHTLSKWAKLDYLSHYLVLFSYIMYYLI